MRRVRAAAEFAEALAQLAATTVQMKTGQRRAIARETRSAIDEPDEVSSTLDPRELNVFRTQRAVSRAKRIWPFEVLCLQTALVLRRILKRRGVPAVVKIGVQQKDDAVLVHAWVEAAGAVLDDQSAAVTFHAFPSRGVLADAPAIVTERSDGA